MKNKGTQGQNASKPGFKLPVEEGYLFLGRFANSHHPRVFIKRYLQVLEALALVTVLCMGYLLWAAMVPSQGDGMFVDVVSGKIFALIGRNSF